MEEPTFIHHAETTNIQLFFDLFFVANLSSFNEVHDINSSTCKFFFSEGINANLHLLTTFQRSAATLDSSVFCGLRGVSQSMLVEIYSDAESQVR